VVEARSTEALQGVVAQAPRAQAYFSAECATYGELVYGDAAYTARLDKSETYSVEGGNADLRHYLARLARTSRCFSRCLEALRRALKLFVWAYNRVVEALGPSSLRRYAQQLLQSLGGLLSQDASICPPEPLIPQEQVRAHWSLRPTGPIMSH
jgi:IS1 family transposase